MNKFLNKIRNEKKTLPINIEETRSKEQEKAVPYSFVNRNQ